MHKYRENRYVLSKSLKQSVYTDGRVSDEIRERVPGAGNWNGTTAVSVEPVAIEVLHWRCIVKLYDRPMIINDMRLTCPSLQKTGDVIELPFGVVSGVGPRNGILD